MLYTFHHIQYNIFRRQRQLTADVPVKPHMNGAAYEDQIHNVYFYALSYTMSQSGRLWKAG